jgi:AraC family transcriptional regulator
MDAQFNAGLSIVPNLPERGETARLSIDQLHSAIAEISRVLDEALRDDCTNAALYLRRAQNLLKPAAQPEKAPGAISGPRLIAWQRRRVLEHIDANLAMPLRNRELAALVNFSEFHFNVAFRNSLGTSPHEFVIRRRIERAQQLMLTSDMSLCEIAGECGLADQAHLSRLFRKVVGETPAAWRKCRVGEIAVPSASAAR